MPQPQIIDLSFQESGYAIRATVALLDRDGCHVLPGGRLEPSETAEDALRREIREETGLQLADFQRIGFIHLHHLKPKPLGHEYAYRPMKHWHFPIANMHILSSGRCWPETSFSRVYW